MKEPGLESTRNKKEETRSLDVNQDQPTTATLSARPGVWHADCCFALVRCVGGRRFSAKSTWSIPLATKITMNGATGHRNR